MAGKSKWTIDKNGRQCTVCGTWKEYPEFGKEKKGANGHACRCRVCVSRINAEKRRAKGIPARHNYNMNALGQTCSKCNKWKPWSEFQKRTHSPTGYRGQCKVCNKEYRDKYNEDNKESLKEARDIFREKNKDHIQKQGSEYYSNNKVHIKEVHKNYNKKNKNKISERNKKRHKNDPEYRLAQNLRGRFRIALNDQDAEKFHHTMELIGCSPAFMLNYLNTTASNELVFGEEKVEVDHILACANFTLQNELEQLICFNWRNMQLLLKSDNIIKHTTLPDNAKVLYNGIKEVVLREYPELKHLEKSWEVWCRTIYNTQKTLKSSC